MSAFWTVCIVSMSNVRPMEKQMLLLFLSIVMLPGMVKKWQKASGWEIWTSEGNTQSDILAESLIRAAEENFCRPENPCQCSKRLEIETKKRTSLS